MSETQFEKEKYAFTVQQILGRADLAVDIEHFLEWSAPTEELAAQARIMLPHVYSNSVGEWTKHNLTRIAIKCAYEDLQRIRREKLSTHREGAAVAFLFKKTLDMYSLHLLFPSVMNPIEQGFTMQVKQSCNGLQEAFDPLFQSLKTEGADFFTKQEKHVLVRAFWQRFAAAFEHFWDTNPHELAITLYEEALKKVG